VEVNALIVGINNRHQIMVVMSERRAAGDFGSQICCRHLGLMDCHMA
jgi:hypothetical protein